MNSLYSAAIRQTTSLQADLERFRTGESSASLQGQISASLAAFHRTVEDYDSMAKREMIQAKQEKALLRAQKFRSDYNDLKTQFEQIKTQASNERAATQRSELFASSNNALSPSTSEPRRRWANSNVNDAPSISESPFRGSTPTPAVLPNSTLRQNHALDEDSFIKSTEARLDDFIAQGQEVLNNLVDQRNILKGTQRRLLSAANTLGLSREVIGWIERRRRSLMPSAHDYTEGATEDDLQSAYYARVRERRSSQSSLHDDIDDGAVFDGPGHAILPSSVTTMHHERPLLNSRSGRLSFSSRHRRRSEDRVSESLSTRFLRRTSHESQRSVDEHAFESDEEEGEADIAGSHIQTLRRQESHTSRSVFENVARFFRSTSQTRSPSPTRPHSRSSGRSRLSTSRRGSDYGDDDDETVESWGYSSQEETPSEQDELLHQDADLGSPGSEAFGSLPPSPTGSLPFLSTDPLFGDTRIEFEELPPREDSPLPPPGPPRRQKIHLVEEDITIRFIGYETVPLRQFMWRAGCVLSLGMLSLAGHWFPRFWLRWVAREVAFKEIKDGFIVVEMPSHDIILIRLEKLLYPYPITTIFSELRVLTPYVEDPPLLLPSPTTSRNNKAHLINELSTPLALTVVDYRYTRYILNPETGLFGTIKDWRDSQWRSISEVRNGLKSPTRRQRSVLFGSNLIDIQDKSAISLLLDEVDGRVNRWHLYVLLTNTLDNIVNSSIAVRERDSADLVPGDIINLSNPELTVVPADLILLTGDAIINESMLTGESVPISKAAINDVDLDHWRETGEISGQLAKGFMYSGTRIIRIRGTVQGIHDSPATAMVVRIGFNTTKGALIRSMLFPKPMGFKFYRDSMRFIGVLALIAIFGFMTSAVQFIRLQVPWQTIIIRALDLITVVVPPALPATLSIGTSFAISRLRKLGIFCISPSRVNVAGKINVVCFDKTGTLTEDGLDVLGVRCLERSGDLFGDLLPDVHDLPLASGKVSFLHALATCHSLKVIEGSVMGDPLDVKMFQFTNWILEEGHIGVGAAKSRSTSGGDRPVALVQMIVRPPGVGGFKLEDALRSGTKHAHFLELGVIRMFEFIPALRRMSVIVKRLKSPSMEIYVKGAPDMMSEICDKSSFPRDYDDLLSYYTNRGFRVIAVAGKSIEGLTWLKAQRMKREQAESGLQFLGLIIFENKIKAATTPAILTLRSAHLGCRMVTGDNVRTAISVARECGMISQSAHIFCPAFVVGNSSARNSKLEWSSVDDNSLKLDNYSLRPLPPPSHVGVTEIEYPDYALALTGDVFRWMINHASLETLQRMLVKAQVFARMSPDEKHELVERLQSLGYVVAFCGDGANDCGALKAADVGLSLSEAEASVAAPFTSRTQDIGCMIDVIKEGRAALVTSFSCFKYIGTDIALLQHSPQTAYSEPGIEESAYKHYRTGFNKWCGATVDVYLGAIKKLYILVAAVFSIGPPYREPMWSNTPPAVLGSLLELLNIPMRARAELLAVVLINVVLSVGFERYCQESVANLVGKLARLLRRRGRRVDDGKVYKAVENKIGWVVGRLRPVA
ncbi:hypothetical protein Clacol_000774 [Clathrus columnatus]|uniref:Cation-transporting ATPase n=1 Tax=Clathrus columnatus TaxID=1419009 RepID=A0AAV5A0N3_9AGAM|nr:hypothetical protein Clacol_000774 [Clathrus columnatus]